MFTINNEATTDEIKILANLTAEWFGEEDFDDEEDCYFSTQIFRSLALKCSNDPKAMREHIAQGVRDEFRYNDYFNNTVEEYMQLFELEDGDIKQDIKEKLANVHLCYLEQLFIQFTELGITKHDDQEFDEIFEKRFGASEYYFANTILTPVINSVEFNELYDVLIQCAIKMIQTYINTITMDVKVSAVINSKNIAKQYNNDINLMWDSNINESYNLISQIPYFKEYISKAINKSCFKNKETKQEYIGKLLQPMMSYTNKFNKTIINLSRIYSDIEIAKLINYEKLVVDIATETLKNPEFKQLVKLALNDVIMKEIWNIGDEDMHFISDYNKSETTEVSRPKMSP